MQPKVTACIGTCSQCAGDGEVVTIEADPVPLSLCPGCLGAILSRATGARAAILQQFNAMNSEAAGRRDRRLAELEEKASEDLAEAVRLAERLN